MSEIKIIKKKLSIGEEKDMQNSLALSEDYKAFMDYIAVCDHPEILADEEIISEV